MAADNRPLEHIEHGIPPVFDGRSEVLVLGTMPSPKSREAAFFYGHPQNRFWRVLAALFDEPVPEDNAERTDLLLRHHIALWDVLASCDIRGASDASIVNPVANDLSRVLDGAPVRAVFCTGATAAKYYGKLCEPAAGLPAITLPSPSPANAAWSLPRLVEAYRSVAEAVTPFEPPVLPVPEVVALEQAIAAAGTPLDALMRRAGRFLAYEARKMAEAGEGAPVRPHDAVGNDSGSGASGAVGTDSGYGVSGVARADLVGASSCSPSAPTMWGLSRSANAAATQGDQEVAPTKRDAAERGSRVAAQGDREVAPTGSPRADTFAPVVIFCGNGNNGGDGWVAAEYLDAWGVPVRLVTALAPEELTAEPARAAALRAAEALSAKSTVAVAPSLEELRALVGLVGTAPRPALIIDAILGTGFAHATVRPPFDAWIRAINEARAAGAPVLAADVPSGLSAQTGAAAADVVTADTTLTMIVPKPGLLTPEGRAHCGRTRVAPLAYIEPLL